MKKTQKLLALFMALTMLLGILPLSVSALTISEKPADGTSVGAPFVKGNPSTSYRIPAMVTTADGTIVAAADARWNTTYDGGGLDTIVARSEDKGANWKYTFANYLGDNGNVYNGSGSSCFIDPCLIADGNTVYMLVDLYPYGVALNGSGNVAPSTEVGFDSDGRLLLSGNDHSSYEYYLKDGKIYKSNTWWTDEEVSGYTVDEYFNITDSTGYTTNLFFSDSPYKVVRTGYLYLTKSTDAGATWSAPTLIPNVKTSSEMACLVGPGNGVKTADGALVFPVYSFNGSTEGQRTGFIYSTDAGATWKRSDGSVNWSSESAIVPLDDGTLRIFYRNGTAKLCYVDVTGNATDGYTWGSAVTTSNSVNSNTQLSAIKYSEKIDGKEAILVSCPTGPNSAGSSNNNGYYRVNGKVFVGLVNDDGTMTWSTKKSFNSTNFIYSSMTELEDGSIAILYENLEEGWGTDHYYTMAYEVMNISDLTDGTIGDVPVTDFKDETTNVTIQFGTGVSDVTVTKVEAVDAAELAGKNYVAYDVVFTGDNGEATVTLPLSAALINSANVKGFHIDNGTVVYFDGTKNADGTFTFTVPHFSVVGAAEVTAVAETPATDIEVSVGGDEQITLDGVYIEDTTISGEHVQVVVDGTEASTSTSAPEKVTSIESGKEYYISDGNGNYLTLNGGTISNTTDWTAAVTWKITGSNGSYTIASGDYKLRYSYSLGVTTTGDAGSWYYDSSNGFYVTSGYGKYYLGTNYRSTWTASRSTNNLTKGHPYAGGSVSTPASTTITFTGVLPTDSPEVVTLTDSTGNVYTYNVTVPMKTVTASKAMSENATLSLAGEVTETGMSVTWSATGVVSVDQNGNVTSGASTGKGEVKAVVKKGDIVVAEYVWNITVAERGGLVDSFTVAVGGDKTIEIPDLQTGETVVWSATDAGIAGVAVLASSAADQAVVVGRTVGDTVVTGTVKDVTGATVAVYTWNVTVTEKASSGTGTRTVYISVDVIEHCKVYYSINGGELIEVNGTGVAIDETIYEPDLWNIMFFAAPEDGYALTHMNATNTNNQYYTLSNGNSDGTGSDAWPFDASDATVIPSTGTDSAWKDGHGFRWPMIEGNISIAQMKVLFAEAIALGCDGVSGITMNNTNNGASKTTTFSFRAQKLPELEKEIVSITRANGNTETYAEGMEVSVGDTINYEITVYEAYISDSTQQITYSDVSLTDTKAGLSKTNWTSGTAGTRNEYTVHAGKQNEVTFNAIPYVHKASITLTMDNYSSVVEHGEVVNHVELAYDYKSAYSSGSLSASANAVAEVKISLPSYVIDFAQPMTINLNEGEIGKQIQDIGVKSVVSDLYGAMKVSSYTLTYVPQGVMTSYDHLLITLNNGKTCGIYIVPTSTMYYEANYMTLGSFTLSGDPVFGSQTSPAQQAGDTTANYGYDDRYAKATASAAYAYSAQAGSTGTFTFTGTGVDIYANCKPNTGGVAVIVENSAGAVVSFSQIDTAMTNGTSDSTSGQSLTNYNAPIASLRELGGHDTYTVTLVHVNRYVDDTAPIEIDGFRVYDTIGNLENIAYADDEKNPVFVELRDAVLGGMGVNTSETGSVYNKANGILRQVYDGAGTWNGAVVVGATPYADDAMLDLLDHGPKNELFLKTGQAVTFTLTEGLSAQIGMKSVGGTEITYSVTGITGEQKITAITDMFYHNVSGTVTITNNGGGTLSLTLMKVFGTTASASVASYFAPVTEAQVARALLSIGYNDPSVALEDAALQINLTDYSGKVVSDVTLAMNDFTGTLCNFSASDILAAVEEALPAGYAVVNKDAVSAASVVCGETMTVCVQVGLVAEITVNYCDLASAELLGTTTIEAVQTSAKGFTRISAADVKAGAPKGTRAIWMLPLYATYGTNVTVNVPVI